MYYYSDGENTYGPYSIEQLREYRDQGYVTDATWIWDPETGAWIAFAELNASVSAPVTEVRAAGRPPLQSSSFDCKFHPGVDPTTMCSECEANICSECARRRGSSVYCPDCAPEAAAEASPSPPLPHPAAVSQPEPVKTPKQSHLKLYAAIATVVIFLFTGIGAAVYFIMKNSKTDDQSHTTDSLNLKITTDE